MKKLDEGEAFATADSIELLGLEVARIGFGAWQAGGHGWGMRDDSAALEALLTAMDSGIGLIDTADVYGLGHSESLVRRALDSRPSLRSEIVVSTKGGVAWDSQGRTRKDASPGYLRQAVEGSLSRLGTDAIDLYYLHWPDGITEIEDSVMALADLRTEGKIKAIGVSNFGAEQVSRVADFGLAAVQVKGNILEPEDLYAVATAARKCGARVVGYSGLADGLLTGAVTVKTRFDQSDHRSRYPLFQAEVLPAVLERVSNLSGVATQLGKTTSQVALRWLLDVGYCDLALVGSLRSRHVVENMATLGWRLPASTVTDLSETIPLMRR